MTDLLLRNKKLLNENNINITNFVYNNEIFNSQPLHLITLFKKRYNIRILVYMIKFPYINFLLPNGIFYIPFDYLIVEVS